MAKNEKKFSVNVSKNAKNDLREIIRFIAINNPMNALDVLKRIEARMNSLVKFHVKGGYVPELLKHNIKDYRQLIEQPWKIIYKIENNIVNILCIIDTRRNTQDLLVEKLVK